MRPGGVELVFDRVDDGPGDLQHEVVPLPAILAADIHAADERQARRRRWSFSYGHR